MTDRLALVEEVTVRLQRGDDPARFAADLGLFLKDPTKVRIVPATDEMATDEAAPSPVVLQPLPFMLGAELRDWMQGVYDELGIKVRVPMPPRLIKRRVKLLTRYGFRLFYVPALIEAAYPASFVKPAWGRYLTESAIERIALRGGWIAIETIAKPDYTEAVYPYDSLMQAIHKGTRFATSYDDLTNEGGALKQIADVLDLSVQLPTVEIWNFVANVFNHLRSSRNMNLPDLGLTSVWEWCRNTVGSVRRCVVGCREYGGLAAIYEDWDGCRYRSYIAFRFLVVFF